MIRSGKHIPSSPAELQLKTSLSRSCHNCNQKKIRCDKKVPCSSCVRLAKTCSYPQPGPRIRRSKKTVITDMASRLYSLERLVDETKNSSHAHDAEETKTVTASIIKRTQVGRKIHTPTPHVRSQEDVLVQNGSTSQYFNEILVSRMVEEEHAIKSAFATPATESSLSSTPQLNLLGILSSPSSTELPHFYHPPKSVALKLWNTYINKVEGCLVLKITHLPTDQIKIYSAINDPARASFDNLAFCLSVYFAAVVSLDEDEAWSILNTITASYLLSLKIGIEQAFAHGNILDRPTLTALRALALYLSALRVHNHSKGIWILNGLAIRFAKSLGIHQDGKKLGLPPFEAEIRRRLWWHLLSRDVRAGEDYGLEDTGSHLMTQEVNPPLNINDSDLYPEMTTLPPARNCWTAMTFSLIMIDLALTTQKLATIANTTTSLNEAARAHIINAARIRIEEQFLKSCNPVIPLQRRTLLCSRFLLRKLDFITRQQWLLLSRQSMAQPQSSDEQEDRPKFATTEEGLIEALEILEANLYDDEEDELLKQYAWIKKAYPQYHVTLYVLWYLCTTKSDGGANVKRAWDTIDLLCSNGRWENLAAGADSKATILTVLKKKAMALRVKVEETSSLETPLEDGDVEAINDFDFDVATDDEWSAWTAFVEGF